MRNPSPRPIKVRQSRERTRRQNARLRPERFNELSDSKDLGGSSWNFTNSSGTASLVGNVITTANGNDRVTQPFSFISGQSYTFEVVLLGTPGSFVRLRIYDGVSFIATTVTTAPDKLTKYTATAVAGNTGVGEVQIRGTSGPAVITVQEAFLYKN